MCLTLTLWRPRIDEPTDRVLAFFLLVGIVGTFVGVWQCLSGHSFAVAARHEATTVGRIVRIYHGKGGPTWRYTFTVSEVRFDGLHPSVPNPA